MVYSLDSDEWLRILIFVCLYFIKFGGPEIHEAVWYNDISLELKWMKYTWMYITMWFVAKTCLFIAWFLYWEYFIDSHEWSNTVISLFLMCIIVCQFYPLSVQFPPGFSVAVAAGLMVLSFALTIILFVYFKNRYYIGILAAVFLAISFVGTMLDLIVTLYRTNWEQKKINQRQLTHKFQIYQQLQQR